MEGSTANDFELTLSAGDPTADRTVTFPDATGTVALTSDITLTASSTTTLTNKTISFASNTLTGVAPLESPTFTGTVTLPANSISQSNLNDDSVGTNEIGGLAVTTGKIADGAVTSLKIADDTIVNADINSAAAIAQSKIADLTTDLAAKAALSGATFTGAVSGTSLTLSGDLTVNGTTTTINSTTLAVDDKNIVLGDVATPTDTTADGGGITLKGSTDKTINWVDATDAWTSSEDFNLLTGKVYEINGTTVLSSTEVLGKSVPSGTIVGTSDTQTLTSKTLTSPIITGLTLNDASIVFEGATEDAFETTLTVTDPTADRTLTLPDATGTLLSTALFSAKGTILIGTGSGTFTSQSVGANGSVLTADSAEEDGVKWVAASGGASFSEFMLIGA
jgi:hypothetical protein